MTYFLNMTLRLNFIALRFITIISQHNCLQMSLNVNITILLDRCFRQKRTPLRGHANRAPLALTGCRRKTRSC